MINNIRFDIYFEFYPCYTVLGGDTMNTKLSQLPSPALAGVVKATSAARAIADIRNCYYGGATMIDLHMSCLDQNDDETLKRIIDSSPLPVLALNYNITFEKTNAGFSEEERAELFLRAASVGAAGVDIQAYTFDIDSKMNFIGEDKYSFTKGNPREVVTDETVISKQCELIEKVHATGAEVLLSCHPAIPMNTERVVDLALYLEKRNPDIIKIVTLAKNEDDLYESIRAMTVLKKEVKTPVAYHATGKAGIPSRIINPLLGGHIAFCVEHYDEASDINQLDLRMAKNIVENVRKIK